MSYVITEKCLGERYATCVAVCPVDCIHAGEYQDQVFMVIDPDTCIDCSLCKPECPIDAIVETEDEDPPYAALNRELTPQFMQNEKVPERPRDDPPRKPTNTIVNP
jgi:ferredoxin